MRFDIRESADGVFWIWTGRSYIGPFASMLSASEYVLEKWTQRAVQRSGNNVYFLEGIAK